MHELRTRMSARGGLRVDYLERVKGVVCAKERPRDKHELALYSTSNPENSCQTPIMDTNSRTDVVKRQGILTIMLAHRSSRLACIQPSQVDSSSSQDSRAPFQRHDAGLEPSGLIPLERAIRVWQR